MPKTKLKIKVKVNGHELDLLPETPVLVKRMYYYKRRKNTLFQCDVVSCPPNAWVRAIEYAEYLRNKYGIETSVHMVATKNGRFLKFVRSNGVPIYIAESGELYVTRSATKRTPEKVNVAIRYFAESCGYKVKERKIVDGWV